MKLSLRSYIRHVRKQGEHIQRFHAVIFAGTITFLLAALILYAQYGFWHTVYDSREVVVREEEPVAFGSPLETFSRLFTEGKVRFKEAVRATSPLTGEGETFDRSSAEVSQ